MISEQQLEANRANARNSTGPRTATGKAIAAGNSMTHGLRAQAVRLCWESQQEFDEFAIAMQVDLAPVGALEQAIADHIIAALWRVARLEKMETGMLYKRIINVAEIENVLPKSPDISLPSLGMTTQELLALPETLLGSAIAFDSSEGSAMQSLDRYRRTNERTINESLDRLRNLQQDRRQLDENSATKITKRTHFEHEP